jgi:steroid delta-isomerase-like uncharacterized protein
MCLPYAFWSLRFSATRKGTYWQRPVSLEPIGSETLQEDKEVNAIQVAHRYFEAWNRRDAKAIIATFAEDGTYSDPSAGQGLTGESIAAYAKGLWAAFPDLSFEIISAAETDGGVVGSQWLMRGTNTGSLLGLPPTGRTVAVPGADFIQVEGEKIRSVQGYFDSRAVPEQLGLQVLVQPHAIGPFSFGTSTSVRTGKKNKPGAFGITVLEARSEEEIQQIKELSRQTATEMLEMPGFIGWVGMTIGPHMMTVTAWETPEHPQQLRGGSHGQAMRKFFGPELAAGGTTSVWVPERINAMWVRCTACGAMADVERLAGKCQCGQSLPEHMPYW